MNFINRLTNRKNTTQHKLFEQGVKVKNKDIHIITRKNSIKVYERKMSLIFRKFKQRISG